MPIVIILGYMWPILGKGVFLATLIREQPQKGPCWVGLRWLASHLPIELDELETTLLKKYLKFETWHQFPYWINDLGNNTSFFEKPTSVCSFPAKKKKKKKNVNISLRKYFFQAPSLLAFNKLEFFMWIRILIYSLFKTVSCFGFPFITWKNWHSIKQILETILVSSSLASRLENANVTQYCVLALKLDK